VLTVFSDSVDGFKRAASRQLGRGTEREVEEAKGREHLSSLGFASSPATA